ncbi:MAG: hypothetical protein AABY86_03470 [Bdellovibrionota bacterium]
MVRLILFFLALGLLAVRCGSTRPQTQNALLPYLTGEDLTELNSMEIRSFLTQTIYMAGGQYEIQATPITLPLLEKEALELQRQRGLTDEELRRVIDHNRFTYYDERFCADIQISIVKFGQVADLDQWKMELIDTFSEHYSLRWVDPENVNGPVVTYFSGLYGLEKKWYNQGRICSNVAIDRTKGFTIQAIPSFVQWPFPPSAGLSWGLEVPSNYQEYRGY